MSTNLAETIQNVRPQKMPDGTVVQVADIVEVIVLADDREMWERQDYEDDGAWAAFQEWLASAPHDRRFTRMSRAVEGRPAATTLSKWAKRYRWRERTVAFDNYVAAQEQQALIDERVRHRRETASLGRQIREKAQEALAVFSATLFKEHKDPKTGEVVRELRSSLTPSEIARLAETGTRLERLALDLDNSNPDGSPKATEGPSVAINILQQNFGTERDLLAQVKEVIASRERQAKTIEGIARTVTTAPTEIADADDTG